MSFVFPPKGWALCNGQLLPINQNQALFSLLGTTYGGDGRVNFALPEPARAASPIHMGSGHTLGERGGEQAHTLSIAEIPTHTHVLNASTHRRATRRSPWPPANFLARTVNNIYGPPDNLTRLDRRAPSRTSAAARRTSTCSRSWRSTSASPCRAFSRRRPKGERTMAQPYVGEIRMFAGNFAPAGWMFCEGQLLPISENETLFNLIGTTYGGDGQSTFALPDLRGRDADPPGQRLHPGGDRRGGRRSR